MKIKPPKHLGKLRYTQYSDVASVIDARRSALRYHLLLLLFCTALSVFLIVSCVVHNRAWSDWLVAAFMTFGTILAAN